MRRKSRVNQCPIWFSAVLETNLSGAHFNPFNGQNYQCWRAYFDVWGPLKIGAQKKFFSNPLKKEALRTKSRGFCRPPNFVCQNERRRALGPEGAAAKLLTRRRAHTLKANSPDTECGYFEIPRYKGIGVPQMEKTRNQVWGLGQDTPVG